MLDLNYDPIDIVAAVFSLIALVFGIQNMRKDGDAFVAVVSFIVALTTAIWIYFNKH